MSTECYLRVHGDHAIKMLWMKEAAVVRAMAYESLRHAVLLHTDKSFEHTAIFVDCCTGGGVQMEQLSAQDFKDACAAPVLSIVAA